MFIDQIFRDRGHTWYISTPSAYITSLASGWNKSIHHLHTFQWIFISVLLFFFQFTLSFPANNRLWIKLVCNNFEIQINLHQWLGCNVPKKVPKRTTPLYSPLTGGAIVTGKAYVTKMAVPAHVCVYWSVWGSSRPTIKIVKHKTKKNKRNVSILMTQHTLEVDKLEVFNEISKEFKSWLTFDWNSSDADLRTGITEERRDRILRTLVRNVFHYHLNEIYHVLR